MGDCIASPLARSQGDAAGSSFPSLSNTDASLGASLLSCLLKEPANLRILIIFKHEFYTPLVFSSLNIYPIILAQRMACCSTERLTDTALMRQHTGCAGCWSSGAPMEGKHQDLGLTSWRLWISGHMRMYCSGVTPKSFHPKSVVLTCKLELRDSAWLPRLKLMQGLGILGLGGLARVQSTCLQTHGDVNRNTGKPRSLKAQVSIAHGAVWYSRRQIGG